MFLVTITFLLALELLAWKKFHDVKSPGFFFGIPWIITLLNLRTMSLYSETGEGALIIILIGAIVFQFGFNTGIHVKIDHREYNISPNNRAMKWLIAILVIVAIPVITQYMSFIRNYGGSLYSAIRSAETTLRLPVLFDYYRKITQFLFISFAVVYWREPLEKRKGIRPYVLALFIIAALATISVPTRNSILFFALPLVMTWYSTHNTSNKRIVWSLLISAIGFLLIFYVISTGKYWYMYAATGANRYEIIKNEIQTYLSGSIVALSSTWKSHSFTRLGGNTFRFFVAIYDAIFGSNNAVALVNEFITFANGVKTNVYTFYDFYLRDFGILYAMIVQFVIAAVHGISYMKMRTGNLFSIFLFAMLSYPLMMQFFQDQYFSLLSTWIQIFAVGAIVLKTNLFFRKEFIG